MSPTHRITLNLDQSLYDLLLKDSTHAKRNKQTGVTVTGLIADCVAKVYTEKYNRIYPAYAFSEEEYEPGWHLVAKNKNARTGYSYCDEFLHVINKVVDQSVIDDLNGKLPSDDDEVDVQDSGWIEELTGLKVESPIRLADDGEVVDITDMRNLAFFFSEKDSRYRFGRINEYLNKDSLVEYTIGYGVAYELTYPGEKAERLQPVSKDIVLYDASDDYEGAPTLITGCRLIDGRYLVVAEMNEGVHGRGVGCLGAVCESLSGIEGIVGEAFGISLDEQAIEQLNDW